MKNAHTSPHTMMSTDTKKTFRKIIRYSGLGSFFTDHQTSPLPGILFHGIIKRNNMSTRVRTVFLWDFDTFTTIPRGNFFMPPVNILIKPASSACNMACAYCFYRDVASNRETAFEGMLSLETMETVIRSAFEYADHLCSFTFQGGRAYPARAGFFPRGRQATKSLQHPRTARGQQHPDQWSGH